MRLHVKIVGEQPEKQEQLNNNKNKKTMATQVEFKYAPMFQLGEDKTEYRLLSKEGVSVGTFEGKEIVKVSKEALTLLAQQAFHDVEFMCAVSTTFR